MTDLTKIQQDIETLLEKLDTKQRMIVATNLQQTTKHKATQQEGYIKKDYMDFEFVATAYRYILDNSCTAIEALEYAAITLDYPNDYVVNTKDNKFYYTKTVVDTHDKHPKQKRMLKDKTLNKTLIKKSSSPSQLTNTLSRSVEVQDKLDSLREVDKLQQEEINTLKVSNDKHEQEIKDLQELTGVTTLSLQEQAKYLYDRNHSKTNIAKALGVNRKTISRWLS